MEIYASSPGGNAYAIMAAVGDLLKEAGRADEWPKIRDDMRSGDYRHLCKVAEEVTFGSIRVVFDDE